jgi:hypothetical protein
MTDPLDTPPSSPPASPVDRVTNALRQLGESIKGKDKAEYVTLLQARIEQLKLTDEELKKLQERVVNNVEIPEVLERMFEEGPEARKAVLQVTREELETLKASIFTPSGIGDSLEKAAEKVLPEGWSKKMSRNQKIAFTSATGIVVGVVAWKGISWLLSRGKKSVEAGKEAAKKSGGWLKKILIISGVSLAAFFGIDYLRRKFSLGGIFGAGKDKLSGIQDRLSQVEFGREPWKKYGLDEQNYLRVTEIYRTQREGGTVEIHQIFNEQGNTDDVNYNKFIEDMQKKYEIKEADDVPYARAEVALKNYESNLEVALSHLQTWVENHYLEVAVGTYLAARLGILRAILAGGATTAKKSLQIANAMRRWGMRHPIISLFLLGGSAVALWQAIRTSKDKAFLPENLQELTGACALDKPLFLGSLGSVSADKISSLREYAKEVGHIGSDYGVWLAGQIGDFIAQLDTSLPEIIGLEEDEVILQRNTSCMDTLRDWIVNGKKQAGTSAARIKDGTVERYEIALKRLDEFQIAWFDNLHTDNSGNDESQKTFQSLQKAMRNISVDLVIENGIVKWKHAQMDEALDFCVDPSVQNKDRIHALSQELYHGESDATYIFSRALQHLRELQQEGADKMDWLTDSKGVAMVLGNFVYFTDPKNVKNYFVAPVDIVFGWMTDPDITLKEWGATVATGTVTTGIFSLNMAMLAKLKRVAVGGGPLRKSKLGRLALNVTPGVSQGNLLVNMYRGVADFNMVRKLGLSRGRYVNNVLSRAGIRPHWIRTIAYGDFAELDDIAFRIGNRNLTKGSTLPELRKLLRKEVIEKLKKVKVRELNLKNWGGRLFTRGKILDFEDVYDDVLRSFKDSNIRVMPRIAPPPLPHSAGKLPPPLPNSAGRTARAVGDGVVAGGMPNPDTASNRPPLRIYDPDADAAVDAADDGAKAPKGKLEPDVIARRQAALDFADGLTDVKKSEKVLRALDEVGISRNLQTAIQSNAEFRTALFNHLDTLDDPEKVLTKLNTAFGKIERASDLNRLSGMVCTEKKMAKLLTLADNGADLSKAFSKMAKFAKILDGVAIVGDAFAIYVTVHEIIETGNMIEDLDKRGGNDELRAKYMQRYAYHAAELGVAGTGIVAGGLVLAGIGSAVATPVAIATLPITAVIYGAYNGHKWEENKTRKAKDWAAENTLVALIADTRSYDFDERVGHAWNISMGDGEWMYAINPIMAPNRMAYRLFSGDFQKDTERLIEDIKKVNREMIEAVVIHTTTIQVPEQVMGDDGEPRDLTDKEVKEFKEQVTAYKDAKVDYIYSQSKDPLHAIKSGADVADLMRNAESFALLAKDRASVIAMKEQAEQQGDSSTAQRLELILDEGRSKTDRAKEYGEFLDEKKLESIYARYLIQSMIQEDGDSDKLQKQIEIDIGNYLVQKSKPVFTKFHVRANENNIVDWWPDGNAEKVIGAYLMPGYNKILKGQSSRIAQILSEAITKDLSGEKTEQYRSHPVTELRNETDRALKEIEDHLLGQTPMEIWESISESDREKFASAYAVPQGAYMPDLEEVGDRKQDAVHIEQLVNQSTGEVFAKSGHFYVKGAEGYQFIPIKEGIILGDNADTAITKIPSNDPYFLEAGEYAVWLPGETIDTAWWNNHTKEGSRKINVKENLEEKEREKKKERRERIYDRGVEYLEGNGAEWIGSYGGYGVYKLTYSWWDRAIEFYFDSEKSQWRVLIGDWTEDNSDRKRHALMGEDPKYYSVKNMAWGNSEKYNRVIRRLGWANELE